MNTYQKACRAQFVLWPYYSGSRANKANRSPSPQRYVVRFWSSCLAWNAAGKLLLSPSYLFSIVKTKLTRQTG